MAKAHKLAEKSITLVARAVGRSLKSSTASAPTRRSPPSGPTSPCSRATRKRSRPSAGPVPPTRSARAVSPKSASRSLTASSPTKSSSTKRSAKSRRRSLSATARSSWSRTAPSTATLKMSCPSTLPFFKHLEEVFPGRDIRAHNDEKLHNHGTSAPSPTVAARSSPSISPTAAT